MNRFLIAVAVLGIGVAGCAAGTDEPNEPAPVAGEQKDPPAQIHGAQLDDPASVFETPDQAFGGQKNVRPNQKPPLPDFKPAAELDEK